MLYVSIDFYYMSRVCELTGKSVQTGNNVSHSQRKTRRRYLPNLQRFSMWSVKLGKSFSFRASTSALRTVEASGGLDEYLCNADPALLSKNAAYVRNAIICSSAN